MSIPYKIYENILTDDNWKYLHDFISQEYFNWTYNPGTYGINPETGKWDRPNDTPQLVRHFYHTSKIDKQYFTDGNSAVPVAFNYTTQTHEYIEVLPQIMAILQKMLPDYKPLRIKANLLQPHPDAGEHHPWHYDTEKINCKSMIYYLNDSDGDTFIGKTDTQRISPKANTAVIFPSNIWHASSSPTKGRRMIINYVTQARK